MDPNAAVKMDLDLCRGTKAEFECALSCLPSLIIHSCLHFLVAGAELSKALDLTLQCVPAVVDGQIHQIDPASCPLHFPGLGFLAARTCRTRFFRSPTL